MHDLKSKLKSKNNSIAPLDLRESQKRKKEGFLIIFLAFFFILLTVGEFHLSKVSSTLPFVNSIFFFGLLNVNIIILICLVWLVFRNIGKLFIERRRKILGSRLKTKLVVAFLSFSIIPTLVLFVISAMYINSSFDKWFSLKIQNTLQASLEITRTYYRNTEHIAMHFGEHLAAVIGKKMVQKVLEPLPWVEAYLNTQRDLFALDAIEFYSDLFSERVLSQNKSDAAFIQKKQEKRLKRYPRLPLDLLKQGFSGEKFSVVHHIGSGDLIRCLTPVRVGGGLTGVVAGVLVLDIDVPVSLVNKVDEIASVFDDYKETNPLKYPMKKMYFVILIMITLVILFVAIWIGLYMAKELTNPVERLVLGAQAVGAGDLDVCVASTGHDEITVLVESFNKMTRDLRESRTHLIHASSDLERRKLQLEAVLANVGTGVIVIDNQKEITTFNAAASRLLQLDLKQILSQKYSECFGKDHFVLVSLIDRIFMIASSPISDSGKLHPEKIQWNFRSGEEVRTLVAIATSLQQDFLNCGVIVVIDDITHLIKGQREMAWREVARRIAHEIKNPLTPIKLSAQRLQRRFASEWGKNGDLLKECTDTIIKHTDELKEMVNEFSNFARFPASSPAPYDLNLVLMEVIALFRQAHSDIFVESFLESRVPVFEFDRDQIKRAVINLFDNAIAALYECSDLKEKKIKIQSYYDEQLQMVSIEIEDNGSGMSEELKTRVFEPYFSTKKQGTGLGLSIVKRIVNDHDGFIRVRSSPGRGTQFLIEIPTQIRHVSYNG